MNIEHLLRRGIKTFFTEVVPVKELALWATGGVACYLTAVLPIVWYLMRQDGKHEVQE